MKSKFDSIIKSILKENEHTGHTGPIATTLYHLIGDLDETLTTKNGESVSVRLREISNALNVAVERAKDEIKKNPDQLNDTLNELLTNISMD